MEGWLISWCFDASQPLRIIPGLRVEGNTALVRMTADLNTAARRQTAVVWSCLLFIRSGQNHLARHSERGRKRWEDNIREWTGLEIAKFQRAVENREKCTKLVVKSSVVPKRPLRLRDRR